MMLQQLNGRHKKVTLRLTEGARNKLVPESHDIHDNRQK